MSLRINNNIAAINAHRNLVNTTHDLTKSMEKLSSGYRINQAADNPAGLVISEQFRAQIVGLNRAIDNSEGSINMIQTAEGALTELNALLVSMRELAIHAANEGFNDTAQLEADQAEIDNAISTIDRIAINTQFGTKKLLDGSRANVAAFTSDGTSGVNIQESKLTTGVHYVVATKTAESTAAINTTTYGVALDTSVATTPDGAPANLTDGVHNLDVVRASGVANKDNGSAITIKDNWNNGIDFATGATVGSIFSGGDLSGGTNSLGNGTYTLHVAYQENASITATIDLSFTVDELAGDYVIADIVADLNTAIADTVLYSKVIATTNNGNQLVFQTVDKGANHSVAAQAFVEAEDWVAGTYGDGTGDHTANTASTVWANVDSTTAQNNRGYSDEDFRFKVICADTLTANSSGTIQIAAAGGAGYTTMAALTAAINDKLDDAVGTGWGEAEAGVKANITAAISGVDNDRLRYFSADEGSDYSIQALRTNGGTALGEQASSVLGVLIDTVAITGTDAVIKLDDYTNQISKVNFGAAETLNYTLGDAASGTTGRGTIDITINGLTATGGGLSVGEMLLTVTAAQYSVTLNGGTAKTVTGGIDTTVTDTNGDEEMRIRIDLDATGGAETISNVDSSLVFQIGANVGQTTKIALPNMASTQLGTNLVGNLFASLYEINVTTVQGAQDSQSVIDDAIDTVSTIRGTLGSFQKNTLESNLRNLRIASQNLQASESNIRDTDMASEMSTFVKNQILMQAGTAMLAQGNQLPQIVLSLFG